VYTDSGEDSLFDGDTTTISLQIKELWTSISLGGFAAASNRFYEHELTDTTVQLELGCPKGVLSLDPETSYFGLIDEDDHAIYTMNSIDYSCNDQATFTSAVSGCEDQVDCVVDFDNSWFDSNCLNDKKDHKMYLKMYCKRSTLTLFGKTFTKEQYSWLIFSINFLTLIFFMIFLVN
jgi:hypothetical protein